MDFPWRNRTLEIWRHGPTAITPVRRCAIKPRSRSHADCPPGSERDPVAILAESDPQRLPNLLPIRYQRMAVSSFTFLRGAAAVMAHDLAALPKLGIPVQACGDCHLMNFGAFSTPEGRMLFDINDFDETLPGVDFIIDLKRLVASVAVAARDAGISDKRAKALAGNVAGAYREFMRELAEKTPLEVWYARMDIEREVKTISDAKLRDDLLSLLIKSKKDLAADDNFPHLATTKDGVARIEDHPPLIYHFDTDDTHYQKIHAHSVFAEYQRTLLPERRALVARYRLADIAMKVVGVGSVGTFCAIGLFMTADQEPLFLQVKQALHSVLEKIVAPPPDLAAQGGLRVVEGQRALQAASDLFLGWTEDKATAAAILRPPAQEPPARLRRRGHREPRARRLRQSLRPHIGACPRPHRRSGAHLRLHGKIRNARRSAGLLCHELRGADGSRPCPAGAIDRQKDRAAGRTRAGARHGLRRRRTPALR